MKKLLLILFLSIAYLCTTHAQSFTKLEVKQSMRRGSRLADRSLQQSCLW